MKIFYEWTLEEIKEGEIMNIQFSDNVSSFDKQDLKSNDLGLVRNEGDEDNGLCNRNWTYVRDNKLPEYFYNAMGEITSYKVPIKYHNELKRYFSN